jgi:DNA invertase Pin-like site-specific DNA recombinase
VDVGYIRVSTSDQSVDRQKREIEDVADIDEWYADVEHGDVFTGRRGLNGMIADASEIDRVYVTSESRLGRSAQQTLDNVADIRQQGVIIEIVSRGWTLYPKDHENYDYMTEAFFQVGNAFAEMELEQLRERVQQGIDQAKERGKHMGRVPVGYETDDDGFLIPQEPMYSKVNNFIREVNEGAPKAPTAEFYGINKNTAQSILENSDQYWDEEYIGDEEWRLRNAEYKND